MTQMLNFSARGKIFDIPYKYILENINESVLLRILALLPENMNEKIDNCIYIDINPVYLNDILNFVYKKSKLLPDLNYENIALCRELCYLSVIDEYEPEWINFSMEYNNKIISDDENNNKIINIVTYDKKIIKLLSSSTNLWKESYFKDVIRGKDDKYVISKTNDIINVWVDIDYKMCNTIISIMRDGINVYHKLICKNSTIKKILLYYGICEQIDIDIITNRINRMYSNIQKKNKHHKIDIENKRASCFNEDELESGTYTEYENDWRGGCKKIGFFHVIKNPEFIKFFDEIKRNKMSKIKHTERVDYRDYYDEITWTYSMNREEMEFIEHHYFKYLMGYDF